VLTANVALVAPPATVTLAGTVATDVLLLESGTTAPPAGAAKVNVAVPCEPLPPTTDEGLKVTLCRLGGGVTVSVAVRVTPLSSRRSSRQYSP